MTGRLVFVEGVAYRPAGLPCGRCGGSVLRLGGELVCMQCGRVPGEVRRATMVERLSLRGRVKPGGSARRRGAGHYGLVAGRLV